MLAEQRLIDFQMDRRNTGETLTGIGISFILAEIRALQGQLQGAFHTYQQALQAVEGQSSAMLAGMADLYRGISELHCERDEIKAANINLLKSKELSRQTLLIGEQHRLYIAEAHLAQAQGDLDTALHLLDNAERVYIRGALPDIHPISALRANIWIAQGRLVEVSLWVREQQLSPDDELSFIREFDYITLARYLIAKYRHEQNHEFIFGATRLLERLLRSAKEGGRIGRCITILALQAKAYQAQNNIRQALIPLEQALEFAQPEGYIRVFINEGAAMLELLQEAAQARIKPGYVRRLLKASKQIREYPTANQLLSEPLSERELEVLALLKTDLSGPRIARKLSIALSTMRTHTQNTYNKLDVNDRRAAVRRAEELNLL